MTHTWQSASVEIRGQSARVHSFLRPGGPWGLNSGQNGQQEPLPTEPPASQECGISWYFFFLMGTGREMIWAE